MLGLVAAPVRAQERPLNPAAPADTLAPMKTHALRALAEITVVNAGVWAYNRYLRPGVGEGFKIGWGAWNENFENGFDWDPNNFSTNQFAHPYHGNLYFNAGRSNGYDYWSSMGFAFVGSFQWEFLGEARHPSINDWVNTSVGGTSADISLIHGGEPGLTTNGRIGGWPVGLPMVDIVTIGAGGGSTATCSTQPNPVDHIDSDVHVEARSAANGVGAHPADTTGFTAQFKFIYGDPFQESSRSRTTSSTPTCGSTGTTSEARAGRRRGHARRSSDWRTAATQHMLAVFQNYDYVNNRASSSATSRSPPADLAFWHVERAPR